MPMHGSTFQLPSGARAVRADCTGQLSGADAEGWMDGTDPGGAFYGLPILAVALELDGLTSEARKAFARRRHQNQPQRWIAVVVTNPMLRVTANFVIRVSGNRKQRLFNSERDAVAWLDERVREDAASEAGR